jgi:hypothetical protein
MSSDLAHAFGGFVTQQCQPSLSAGVRKRAFWKATKNASFVANLFPLAGTVVSRQNDDYNIVPAVISIRLTARLAHGSSPNPDSAS